jgi:hypothetical protein
LYGNAGSTLCGPLAINYRGYLYAAIAGTYTFTVSQVDDRAFLWLGETARTGWTAANAVLYNQGSAAGQSITYTVSAAGSYIPMRVVAVNMGTQAGNGANPMTWLLTVRNPYGVDYDVGSNAQPGSANLVRFSCNNVDAPSFSNSVGSEL